jgi:hypothetical protein
MDTNPSLTQQRTISQVGRLNAIQRRVFSRKEGDAPAAKFTNAVTFGVVMNDIFMDVGCITPEAITTATEDHTASGQPDEIPTQVDMLIEYRFAMSLTTAMGIHQQLSLLIAQTMEQMSQQTQQPLSALAPTTPSQEG